MASSFPTALDSFTDPQSGDKLNSPNHITQHQDINDAIEKIEAKVGIDGSADTDSHDYKLSEVTGSDKAVGKTATQTLTNKTLDSPKINGSVSGTAIKDEDDMASNSATALATQQSIKAYVDAKKVNRAFTWGIKGTLVTGDEQGMKYIVPQNMTVKKIWYKTGSGSAGVRIQKNTTTVDTFTAGSSVGSTTSITSASLTAGQVLTLDITSVSSAVDLFVTVECEQ